MRSLLSVLLGATIVTGASLAGAQDLNNSSSSSSSSSSSTASSAGSSGIGGITDTTGATDHSVVNGRLGLRYFGTTSASVLAGSSNPQANGSLPLHTVGVRYWLSGGLGIEAGLSLGLRVGSSSTTTTRGSNTTTVTSDDPNAFGFGLRFGLPIAIAEAKHLTIQLTPYLGLAYANSSIQTVSSPMTGGTGMMGDLANFSSNYFNLEVGANLAAELQFGFFGVPQLGLIAQFGFGIGFTSRNFNVENLPSMTQQSSTISTDSSAFTMGTTVGPQYGLADIINGSISAVWYFGNAPGR